MVQNERAAVLIPGQEKAGLVVTALDDFTPLVRSHQQRIYRVLLCMVRDSDAEERNEILTNEEQTKSTLKKRREIK